MLVELLSLKFMNYYSDFLDSSKVLSSNEKVTPDDVVSQILGLVIIAFIVFIIWAFRNRELRLRVALPSAKSFNSFNTKDYFYNLDENTYNLIKGLTEPGSKKKVLKLTWSYTSAKGNKRYVKSKKFSNRDVHEIVDSLSGLYETGRIRIDALNRLYAERLSEGHEIRDGQPRIYCYTINSTSEHNGLVKVGYTSSSALRRIRQQLKTAAHLSVDYEVLFIMPAITISGQDFKDHEVHKVLKNFGVENPVGEWFKCDAETAMKAVNQVQYNLS